MKKLNVEFVSNSTPNNEIMSDALLTQLMVTITQIGIRVDKVKSIDDIITEETGHGKE